MVTSDGYEMISYHCPNLTNLHLGMCGRIKDADLRKIVDGCPSLKSLELDGPFLCTDVGMSQLSKLSNLESFAISNASKITHKSLGFLNKDALRLVKIKHCTAVGSGIAEILASFSELTELQLEFINDIGEDELMFLISKCGGRLKTLFLEGFLNLSDSNLQQIATTCTSLDRFSLGSCLKLTNEGICAFFEACKCCLKYVSLNRLPDINDDSLLKLLLNQCKHLTHLDLNGLDKLTSQSLNQLVRASNLNYIDISWVRNFDNETLDLLISKCQQLSVVKVYGCNRLTDDKLCSNWTNLNGRKLQIHGNEFD